MEITTNDAAADKNSPPLWLRFGLVALVGAVYFCGLKVPLMGPDEPRYAQVAREMYERGDWMTPTLGGHPWFEKPPLLYWLEIASYNIFGVHEFSARLAPVLCGITTAAALWILARSVDKGFAGLAPLMAAATVGVIGFSHTASHDVALMMAMTCALVSFWKAQDAETNRPAAALVLFYLFSGLAVLAKGLVGLIFPFAIICVFYAASRRMPPRRIFVSMLWGVPLLLLIAVPWHATMYLRYGGEFIDIYFVQHHLERFTTNKFLHPQPFYYFWWVLPVLALPWSPFALVELVHSFRRRVFSSSPFLIFATCWLIVPLIFFSFSGSKLAGYILPSVPPVVLIAWLLVRERMRRAVVLLSVGTLVFALAAINFYLPSVAARDSVKQLLALADARGHSEERILTLFMVSYNAEFYAGDRLVRKPDGSQQMLEGGQLVLDEIHREGRPVLVLMSVEYLKELTEYSAVQAEVLDRNDDTAIVAVSAR